MTCLSNFMRLWLHQSGFKLRVCNTKIFFFFLNQNICCGCSKEPSQWDGSFEHPKHMLKIMGKTIFTILRWKIVALSWQIFEINNVILPHDLPISTISSGGSVLTGTGGGGGSTFTITGGVMGRLIGVSLGRGPEKMNIHMSLVAKKTVLFGCGLMSQSITVVMLRLSVHLTTLGKLRLALALTSTLYTYLLLYLTASLLESAEGGK